MACMFTLELKTAKKYCPFCAQCSRSFPTCKPFRRPHRFGAAKIPDTPPTGRCFSSSCPPPGCRCSLRNGPHSKARSEERRVGKEGRGRRSKKHARNKRQGSKR